MSVAYKTQNSFRADVLDGHRRHVNLGSARLAELIGTPVEVRAEGNYVFDDRGDRYLDCGGYGVFTLGHCHPAIIQAVTEQLNRNPLSSRSLVNPEVAKAAEALSSVAPDGLDYVYFGSTGAEATETALKLACLKNKTKLIAMHNGYHGKTIGALGVTGRESYRTPFRQLLPEVRFVPFGDAAALESELVMQGGESCVILEPVQAEGGVIIPPAGYLSEVQRLCRRYEAFLILDEIQTGLGRLGEWWGASRERITPDVLLVGKALSGGAVPVSAVVASAFAYEELNRDPLMHTSTFSGNPLACAAANATIDVFRKQNVVAVAQELGYKLKPVVERLTTGPFAPIIREVRALGLLIGIEFEAEFLAGDFMVEMLKHKVLVSYSLNAHRVVRLTPPAFLTDADISWLDHALQESSIAISVRYF